MKRHARPALGGELDALHRSRRATIGVALADSDIIRRGLVYTKAGVIDMTRRHKKLPSAPEEIVGQIGGARAW